MEWLTSLQTQVASSSPDGTVQVLLKISVPGLEFFVLIAHDVIVAPLKLGNADDCDPSTQSLTSAWQTAPGKPLGMVTFHCMPRAPLNLLPGTSQLPSATACALCGLVALLEFHIDIQPACWLTVYLMISPLSP